MPFPTGIAPRPLSVLALGTPAAVTVEGFWTGGVVGGAGASVEGGDVAGTGSICLASSTEGAGGGVGRVEIRVRAKSAPESLAEIVRLTATVIPETAVSKMAAISTALRRRRSPIRSIERNVVVMGTSRVG